jgi:putative MFS transporter
MTAASVAPSTRPTIAARIDRLSPSPTLLRLVFWISIAGFFEFYDLFMTGYIGVGLVQAGIYQPATPNFFDIHGLASFVGSGFSGMFVGALFLGRVSDVFGRRATFTYSLLGYSVATLIMAFMSTPEMIDLWRFVAGVGIGVQLITIDTYVTEITPKEGRGQYIAVSQLVAFSAVPFAALASLLLIPHAFFGLAGWRFVAIIGALGALFVPIMRAKLPESPRWLESRGRAAEADELIGKMEEGVRRDVGHELPPPKVLPDEGAEFQRGAWAEIFSPQYRVRTLMLTVFNVFQAIAFYGFAAWVPTLLISEGITVTKSLAFVFIIAILNPLGPLIATRFADGVERRWQIVGLALIIAVCGLLWSLQRSAAGIIILGGLITVANNWFSCAYHAYQAELFPTRIRAQAVGFVYSWSRFSLIFVGFLIAAVLKSYGSTGVFTIIAIAMLIVALTIGVFGLNTNRLRLEAISR